jgi:hypothetical protein
MALLIGWGLPQQPALGGPVGDLDEFPDARTYLSEPSMVIFFYRTKAPMEGFSVRSAEASSTNFEDLP